MNRAIKLRSELQELSEATATLPKSAVPVVLAGAALVMTGLMIIVMALESSEAEHE
jgi:hypothetical protein